MPFTAAEIASHVGGEVLGDPSVQLNAFALPETAKPGDIVFAETDGYFARAEKSGASAILLDETLAANSNTKVLIRAPNPRIAFAKILALFFPPPRFEPGIHSTAIIAKSASIDPSVHIGPWCVVAERVRIGAHSVLQCANHIGADSTIGDETNLFPSVTVYPGSQIGKRVTIHVGTVIGSDGYGYVFDQSFHRKIPQIGNVVIHDDVEIGANVTIDRGALGSTIIGKDTKIDNLVQIGHNVVIGEHCIIIAQVGIAGSTRIGNYTTLAGQAGITGHLKIGNQVTIGAQAGVSTDIPDGEKWLGSPAAPSGETKRIWAAGNRLPELLRRVAELERELKRLKPGAS
ncbi:MAG TPA: UDP-3-O-(3-hydroxymyristoyl)glucosamine N-acyltransferase [Candidatus Binatia bacterium]|nr:UDP-3-O-(3-hydroxymyristoyl)glucosamine N-acyltransferase [Candidatus Binatia bacterium]